MREQLFSLLHRFRRDERGAFLALFGLLAVVLIAVAGAVVDYTSEEQARTRAQVALDAAALALQPKIYDATYDIRGAAENLLINRIGDTRITTTVTQAVRDTTNGTLTLRARLTVPLYFVALVGISSMNVELQSQATRGSMNIEVAVALDTTGSMSGTKISDLRDAIGELIDLVVQDVQTPSYSKMALVPYSMGVNVGSYASQVRGAPPAGVTITNATWQTGSTRTITAITQASPPRITTSADHGFSTGDVIYISGISDNGSNSMADNLNGQYFTITRVSNTRFTLNGENSSGWLSWSSGGIVRRCALPDCEVTLTAGSHGFSNGHRVHIVNIAGMTQLNNNTYSIKNVTTSTFTLDDTIGGAYSAYTSGGKAYCTTAGCEYYYFTNPYGNERTHRISTCVTERVGANQYNDAAPSTTLMGRNYPSTSNPCLSNQIVPLTSNKTTLHALGDNLVAEGSTAGHVGLAWAWYMVSPNFGYLWPSTSQPAAYGAANLKKVVVLMTDGAFNTVYCNGVIAQDSLSGSGNLPDKINCNATNGSSYDQGNALCTQIKKGGDGLLNTADDIIVYTVGFDIDSQPQAQAIMANCATDADHAYLANSGTELSDAFKEIGESISSLRISL